MTAAHGLFFDHKPASETPSTREWVYDLRTSPHFTLMQYPLRSPPEGTRTEA
jgi:hypothetical protein